MLEKGLISLDKDGLCHVSKELDLDTYTFSYSVEALITSRIDLLAPTQALVLKVICKLRYKPPRNVDGDSARKWYRVWRRKMQRGRELSIKSQETRQNASASF